MRNPRAIYGLTLLWSVLIVSNSTAQRSLTPSLDRFNQGSPTLIYNPATGNMSMTADPGITTWEMKSSASLFITENAPDLCPH